MLTLDENLDDIVRVKDDDAMIRQPLNESRSEKDFWIFEKGSNRSNYYQYI